MLQNAILRTCCPTQFVQGVKILDVSAAQFAEKFRFSVRRSNHSGGCAATHCGEACLSVNPLPGAFVRDTANIFRRRRALSNFLRINTHIKMVFGTRPFVNLKCASHLQISEDDLPLPYEACVVIRYGSGAYYLFGSLPPRRGPRGGWE